jgi:hypothetical protein
VAAVKITQILGFIVVVLAGSLLAYGLAQHMRRDDARLIALRDTVRLTDSVRTVVAETVKVKLAAKLRTDTLVQVLTDTQLVVRREPAAPPETVTVLAEISERIRACDAFASSCRLQLAADSSEIRALKTLVAASKPSPRWALTIGPGYGCSSRGCGLELAVGITYRIH